MSANFGSLEGRAKAASAREADRQRMLEVVCASDVQSIVDDFGCSFTIATAKAGVHGDRDAAERHAKNAVLDALIHIARTHGWPTRTRDGVLR